MIEHYISTLLLSLTMLFSGTSVPKDTAGWTIVSAWKQSGGYYYFEAQTETIPELCRTQPTGYVNFPVIIQSAHKVLVDGHVVSRFGDPTFKSVETFYGTPQLKCTDIPQNGKKLVWQVFSSTAYFSHFSTMPSVEKNQPLEGFFNETLAIIAAGTLLLMAIFCFMIFYRKIALAQTLSLVSSCVALSLYFVASNAGHFGWRLDILTTVKISDTSLWIGIALFINCLRLDGLLGKRICYPYAGVIALSVLIILTAADADAEQNGTSLPFAFSIVVLAVAFYRVTRKLIKKEGPLIMTAMQSMSYGIFFIACLNDAFVIMGLYENSLMLPIGIMAGLLFFALAVNEQISAAYRERDHLRQNLEQEVKTKTHDLIIARDEALLATKAKDSFLANMSHEIRTPLTAIIGFAEYSLAHNISNEERLSALRTIVSSSNHLLAIISDLLDFSKIEANSIEVEPLEINPSFMASEVQSIIMPLANKKGLYIKIEYDFPLPPHIVSDPVRLKQILFNVCSNAIKFTEKGGITITLGYDRQNNYVCYRVKDTGIGMTTAQMARIFEPFKQADSSISRRYGGTGLGLSLSRRLAELLGGELKVRSEPDVGSEFTLKISAGDIGHLPLVNDPEQLVERTAASTEPTVEVKLRGNVLLAEDNENNQQLLSLYLKRMGVETTVAEDGKKAISLAKEKDFDLIFMDMQMPVMSGIDAVKLLRQQGYDKPIVALTANATKEDRNQCLEAGCDDFVTKPVTRERFYRATARFLNPDLEHDSSGEPIKSALLEEEPDLADIILQFTERLPEIVDSMRNAYAENSWSTFKENAHTLKGMGGGFGYPQVTDLAAQMEFLLGNSNFRALESMVEELENIAARIAKGVDKNTKTG